MEKNKEFVMMSVFFSMEVSVCGINVKAMIQERLVR
jgi:hypothetical protein